MINKLKKIKNIGNFRNIFLVISVILVCLASLFTTIYFITKDRIYPDISISGIEVGGLPINTAQSLLKQKLVPPSIISLSSKDKKYKIMSDLIDLEYDYASSVNNAYKLKRTNNIIKNVFNSLWIFGPKANIDISYSYDEKVFQNEINKIKIDIETPGQPPSARLVGNDIVIERGKNGIYIDNDLLKIAFDKALINSQQASIEIPLKHVQLEINKDQEREFLSRVQKLYSKNITFYYESYEYFVSPIDLVSNASFTDSFSNVMFSSVSAEIQKSINRNPQDSVFIFENAKVKEFTPSKNGVALDEKAFKELFISVLKDNSNGSQPERYVIPVVETLPKITTESINNMGIKEIIGKGSSNFRGSIQSRIHNIELASSKFNGVIIPPGETFSFNSTLGEVSALTGFQQAYVIRGNETVLGDGGGVCQVSTTLFRAALNAGLPILERAPHSYRVSYYEQGSPPGLDATVYEPSPDLKFKNDTGHHILIQTIFDKKGLGLVFELYGYSDGRISLISKPVITSVTPPPDDLYVDDPTLLLGTIKQIEHKAWGAKVSFDYEVKRGEEIIYSKKFISNYRPWQAKYLRGTKTP